MIRPTRITSGSAIGSSAATRSRTSRPTSSVAPRCAPRASRSTTTKTMPCTGPTSDASPAHLLLRYQLLRSPEIEFVSLNLLRDHRHGHRRLQLLLHPLLPLTLPRWWVVVVDKRAHRQSRAALHRQLRCPSRLRPPDPTQTPRRPQASVSPPRSR